MSGAVSTPAGAASTPSAATALDSVAALRLAFDHGFAVAREAGAAPSTTLLAIRLRGDPFALRLGELAGLHAGRRVTPLPGPLPELLGLAGLRGAVVPVYDLGALLGYPAASAGRWLALPQGAPIGLAFDSFEGALRVADADLAPELGAGVRHQQVRELARTAAGARPVIQVPALLAAIARRARPGG